MASTYTTNLGLEKPGIGEQNGTWGNTLNDNFDLIDEAINGIVAVSLSTAATSGAPNTIPITDGASSNGRNFYIEINDTGTGDLGGDVYLQLTPNDAEKIGYIYNNLTNQDLIVFQGTYNASNDYVIPNGYTALLKFDGAGSGAVVKKLIEGSQVFSGIRLENNVAIEWDNAAGSNVGSIKLDGSDDFILALNGTTEAAFDSSGNLWDFQGNTVRAVSFIVDGSTGLRRDIDTSTLYLSGSNSLINTGGTITLYGTSHATKADDIEIRDTSGAVITYDASAGTIENFHDVVIGSTIIEATGGDITKDATNTTLQIHGGDSSSDGGGIWLYGSTAASFGGDILFREDSTTVGQWDSSASRWDFQSNPVAVGYLELDGSGGRAITSDDNSAAVYIASNTYATFGSAGSRIGLFGSTAPSQANDIAFQVAATDVLRYDDSGTAWDFQANAVTTTGAVNAGMFHVTSGSSVASLPTPSLGMIERVTDASSPAVGSTVTGGGGSPALVWYNGSNWTVIGV